MKLTAAEQEAEMKYRISERIGILCADGTPTPEQLAIATAEADEWMKRYRKENPE